MKWYVMAAVSYMQMDCGGLVFPACAFTAWYTSPEIGSRDLCDPNRRNLLKVRHSRSSIYLKIIKFLSFIADSGKNGIEYSQSLDALER